MGELVEWAAIAAVTLIGFGVLAIGRQLWREGVVGGRSLAVCTAIICAALAGMIAAKVAEVAGG